MPPVHPANDDEEQRRLRRRAQRGYRQRRAVREQQQPQRLANAAPAPQVHARPLARAVQRGNQADIIARSHDAAEALWQRIGQGQSERSRGTQRHRQEVADAGGERRFPALQHTTASLGRPSSPIARSSQRETFEPHQSESVAALQHQAITDRTAARKLEQMAQDHCLICHNHYDQPVATRCGHVFCLGCVVRWLRMTHRCPTCRAGHRLEDLIKIVGHVRQRSLTDSEDGAGVQEARDNRPIGS